MSTEPQWGRVLQKNLDHIAPSVAGVGKAMGELEKSITFVDRKTQIYVNTIQSLHKAFSGVAITAQLKVYEDYAAILDKNNKRTLVYGQSIDGLEKRYIKLSKATNLSVREIGELNAIAAQSIIGKKDFSAIDSQIKRINQYSASVKEVHENFVNLLQIQQKYGVGFKGGGGGGMLRNLTTSELSSMPNEMFFSAAKDAFLGDKKRETGSYKDLSRFQSNRQKFENDYINSLKKTSGSFFNISDGMKKFGEWSGFGQNTPGVTTGTGLAGGMVGALALPTIWSLGRRFLGGGRGAAAGANAAAGALGGGSGLSGGNSYLDLMSGAGSGAAGNTNIPPGNGTTLGGRAWNAFSNRFTRGNLGRLGGAAAIGALAHPLIDWAAPKLGIEQDAADKSKSVLRYATLGAMGGSLFGPIGTGVGAAALGAYGVYKNYGAGASNKKNDVQENERLTQLHDEISKELSAHELNYGRINELVTKWNGLVKGTGQELNENLAVVMSLKDQIDNVAVVQNRINDILQRQSSSYQELSQAYGDGLRMGKESEEFARKGLKSQELQLQIDRDFFRQKMELQQQLEARVQQGDESAIAQQKEEQVLMERKYKINFNQQDILTKNLEIQGKLAQIQNTRIDLDTRATDIQEQNVDVMVQQARTWTSISQSMKMGVLPEASAILNQVAAVNEKVKVQEQGYLNIQKHLAGVNAEIMQLQRGGLDTVQKQEQLHLKMAERNKLQIKGEQQVNKILESRADQLSSLLTLREKAVSALPEVAMMGGQYEMSMDVGLETGAALFRSDANQFVGTSAGRFGMTTPSGGVGHGGGFMMGRGPGVYAMNQPLALGAMPSQGTMGAAAQTVGSYHTGGTIGSKEGLPLDGREVLIKAKTGEHVIPRFDGGWDGSGYGSYGSAGWNGADWSLLGEYLSGGYSKLGNSSFAYFSPDLYNQAKYSEESISIQENSLISRAIRSGKIDMLPEHLKKIAKERMNRLKSGAQLGLRNASNISQGSGSIGNEFSSQITRGLLIDMQRRQRKSETYQFYSGLSGMGRFDPAFMSAHSISDKTGVGFTDKIARNNISAQIRLMNNAVQGMIPLAGGGEGTFPSRTYADTMDIMNKEGGLSRSHKIWQNNEMTNERLPSWYSNEGIYRSNVDSGYRPLSEKQIASNFGSGDPSFGRVGYLKSKPSQYGSGPEYSGAAYSQKDGAFYVKQTEPDISLGNRVMQNGSWRSYAGGGRTLPGPTGGFIAELHKNEVVLNQGQVSRLGLSHSDFSKAGVPGFGGGGITTGNIGGSNHVSVSLDDSGSLRAVVSSSNASNSIMRQNNFVNANQRDGGHGI